MQNKTRIPKAPRQAIELPIAENNWRAQYPYTPKAIAKLYHNSTSLHIEFEVEEVATMARVTADNGEVWRDSCVEFFISFDNTGYYNFEFSCIGKLLLAFRKEKPNPTYASEQICRLIIRESTLGNQPFDVRITTHNQHWRLLVTIPLDAFFMHQFKTLDALEAKANIYKCGDNLPHPHFLSWASIETATPNFHCPNFFADIVFEG